MGLGRNQLSVVSNGATRIVHSALPLDLGSVLAQDRPSLVIADEIIVTGKVGTGGHGLKLVCRLLRFADSAEIVADGAPGVPDFPPGIPRESAHSPGADGLDGEPGGAGQAAGKVEVFARQILGEVRISAVGGPGGRAQDGGNGQAGRDGSPGEDIDLIDGYGDDAQANGGNGSPGGHAGLPGARGAGGQGGVITLGSIEPLPANGLSVLSGRAGAAGAAGQPGKGGAPGASAKVYSVIIIDISPKLGNLSVAMPPDGLITEQADSTPMALRVLDSRLSNAVSPARVEPFRISRHFLRNGTPGQPGKDGDKRESETLARQVEPVGVPGSVDTSPVTEREIGEQVSDTALELLVCAIEDRYRQAGNTPGDDLRAQIDFWLAVCDRSAATSTLRIELMGRLYAMARKISLGLDIHGYSLNCAPLLSFDTYASAIDQHVLPNAVLIEKAFEGYWDAARDKGRQRERLVAAADAASQNATAIDIANEAVERSARGLLAGLPDLDKRVDAAEAALLSAKDTLDGAIRSKGGCDLIGTLSAGATIVAGVASGGAGFIAAASAASKLYDTLTAKDVTLASLWDQRKEIQGELENLSKGANDVSESIATIQKGMARFNGKRPQTPQFIMEREEFDRVAREFADLPEAAQYREAGYDFLKAAESRNQAILDYNAALVQLVDLQGQKAASLRVVAGLRSSVSAEADPAEGYIVVLMSRLYLDALALAAKVVHAERKALAYLFGRPAEAPLSALNVATIASAHILAAQEWQANKEAFRAKRELNGGLVDVELREVVSPLSWEAFKRTRVLPFTLRPDQGGKLRYIWPALPGVRITGVELELQGATLPNPDTQVYWLLDHAGTEIISRRREAGVVFSHAAVTITGFTSIIGKPPLIKPNFTEGNLYAGVSPFATWLLSLNKDPTLELDLSGLTSAKLKLSGFFIEG